MALLGSAARRSGYSLIEILVAVSIFVVLAAIITATTSKSLGEASLAISANNIRQLAAGGMNYLAENNYVFWKYRTTDTNGVTWWFGYEPLSSFSRPEGEREYDAERGPLGGYLPASLRPDPSLSLGGKTFKPKYRTGYIGIGYNGLLGGSGIQQNTVKYWDLPKPSEIVVFATSAQINTFQKPATPKNPMVEEFYLLDEKEITVHFRHHGNAMVAFANGSAGFLPLAESTRDARSPKANIGRFAPKGSTKYLLPETNQ